jgi:hypothetical protein
VHTGTDPRRGLPAVDRLPASVRGETPKWAAVVAVAAARCGEAALAVKQRGVVMNALQGATR